MNDTYILDQIHDALKIAWDDNVPLGPIKCKSLVEWIDQERRPERREAPQEQFQPVGRGTVTNGRGVHFNGAPVNTGSVRPSPYQEFTVTGSPMSNDMLKQAQASHAQCDPAQADHSYNSINEGPKCAKCGGWFFSHPRLGYTHVCRPRHLGSCSNQNVLSEFGAYEGVEECGCRRKYDKKPHKWIGTRGDVGHSAPVWCESHQCFCTDAETKTHKFFCDSTASGKLDTDSTPRKQYFFKCEHHPMAIENFFKNIENCEYGCHTNEPTWSSNGMSG